MAARLAGFIARETGAATEVVRVQALRRLAGGSSREIWALEVHLARGRGGEALDLVLRRDPPGRVGDFGTRALEFQLLRSAARAGVPVPRVYWASEDPEVLGAPFFLMERVAGETLPGRILRQPCYAKARGVLVRQLGEVLARVHRIDPAAPELAGLVAPAAGVSLARAELERTAAAIRESAVEPHPVLDLAERWLAARAPGTGRRAVVHGDFRLGNFVVDEDGVRAVLDWELAHVGDPLEDLGWICTRAWRYGRDDQPVGGLGPRDELVAAYEAASGTRVDPEALRFWEAFGSFKLALVFILQARTYLDGRMPSVDLASLGRRIVEPEAELLRFLEEEEE